MSDSLREVTPPHDEPGRPTLVTVAVVLWAVLGVLLVLTGVLFGIAAAVGNADPATGAGSLVLTAIVLLAIGAGTLVATRGLARGSRPARSALTGIGMVLAIAGLVQLTFLGVGGVYFVAFAAGAVLLHLPAARAWFGRSR
jgi:cation transport ATPase